VVSRVPQALVHHQFKVIDDLLQDMDLIFYNCELYNGTVSEVGKHGVQVKKVWLKAWHNSGLDAVGEHSFGFHALKLQLLFSSCTLLVVHVLPLHLLAP
jgi:hypothetical protein